MISVGGIQFFLIPPSGNPGDFEGWCYSLLPTEQKQGMDLAGNLHLPASPRLRSVVLWNSPKIFDVPGMVSLKI